ncbi:MAG: trypsin-like peptidase domain-containing protein [Clostridia bacterium]|nr:trypsin-like peptidase domain-containing protein [Clostridia bacterium]
MDDIFNPENVGNAVNKEPVQENVPADTAPTAATQQQPQPQAQASADFPGQRPAAPFAYNSVNNSNTVPNNAPQQTMYAQNPRTSPVYYNPNGSTQPVAPAPQKKKKKNGTAGKVIFSILICVSIIFSSIAIGVSIANNDSNNNNVTIDNNNQTQPDIDLGSGADPDVEDSPISYSEYSGKGAMSSEQIYESIKDINVGILVFAQTQSAGEGSGIIVGVDETKQYTYILTAAHVISDKGVNVQIQFSDSSECDAEIVGYDTKTDVGVLRVKKTGFKAATFGNSDNLTVGQKVYAIGNPGGTEFFGSFTSGMISAIDRPVPTTNSSYDLPCIQHNAAINPGNSGGALVNEYGQVIGLNSSKISSTEYEGMGFSVPAKTVLNVYEQIIKYGYVTNRPMLGITYLPVSEDYSYSAIAWKNNLPYGSIVIATINENSDFANHDVKVGDMIIAVNGEKMETTDVLLEKIENADVGDKLKLTICRVNNNSKIESTFDVTVTLVEDKGNTATQTEPETTPFENYFENFGY